MPFPGKMRAKIAEYLAGKLPPPTAFAAVGMNMTVCADGVAEFEFSADDRFSNPMGSLHGGAYSYIADGAMGMAVASTLAEDETFTTLEFKINFLRPVWNAKLTAKGRVLSRGRTVVLTACDIHDDKGRHVASAMGTQMILTGEKAKGR